MLIFDEIFFQKRSESEQERRRLFSRIRSDSVASQDKQSRNPHRRASSLMVRFLTWSLFCSASAAAA